MRLPAVYQRVLAWLDEGCSGDEIAARLGIEPEAALPLVRLAHAKLARLSAALAAEHDAAQDPTDDG